MIQALRSLVQSPAMPTVHSRFPVAVQGPVSTVASPARLAPVDRLQQQARLGSIPARQIQFSSAPASSVLGSGEKDLEQLLALQMQKLEHVAPSLESLPDFKVTPLKIAIEKAQTEVHVALQGATLIGTTPSGESVRLTEISGELQGQQTPEGIAIRVNGQYLGTFGTVRAEHEQESLAINGNAFRGNLSLMPAAAGGFHVVNEVLLEDYLKSVVPSESPASWPQQSLQAQAMAARTYAVANWGKNKADGFDMNDDTSDQVYKGMSTEHPATQEAVAATRSQIITYGNKPITALFFSTSGGHTDSSKEVWGVDLPYIQPVPDFDQAASRYRWNLTRSEVQLRTALAELGHNVGSIRQIEALEHTPHDRVKQLKIVGSRGSVVVDGNKFRFAAKLYSTKFTVKASGGNFTFNGGGWGHALGMSQWGARQMALDGFKAPEIVKHYYQGVDIQSLD